MSEWVSDNNHLYWTFCSSFLWIIFSNKSSEILHWLSAFIQLYIEIIDGNILIYIILISWTFFLYNECFLVLNFFFKYHFYFISKIVLRYCKINLFLLNTIILLSLKWYYVNIVYYNMSWVPMDIPDGSDPIARTNTRLKHTRGARQ